MPFSHLKITLRSKKVNEDDSNGEKARRKGEGGKLVSLLKYNVVIRAAARERERERVKGEASALREGSFLKCS